MLKAVFRLGLLSPIRSVAPARMSSPGRLLASAGGVTTTAPVLPRIGVTMAKVEPTGMWTGLPASVS